MEHGALVVIRDQGGRHAAYVREGTDVAPDPGRKIGRAGRLGVRVVARAEDGDEERDRGAGPRGGIRDPERLAGVVEEQLLAGPVLLAETEVQGARPLAVVHAELAVLEAGRVPGLVLLPEELEGHPGMPELLVEGGPVGQGPRRSRRAPGPPVEPGLEGSVIE